MIGEVIGVDQTEVLLRLQPMSVVADAVQLPPKRTLDEPLAEPSVRSSMPVNAPFSAPSQPTADNGETQDIFESDFDIPALQEEGSEGPATVDTETESSDFDLALDDSELAADEEPHSDVVALEEQEAEAVIREEVGTEHRHEHEREKPVAAPPPAQRSRVVGTGTTSEQKPAPVYRQ
jgi:hypothetical protein